MATQTTGGGSATSFTNTPQANDDSYAFLEDLLRANSTLYNVATNTLLLDVMSNDLGGNAKSLFSVADGDGNPITADFDLLAKDVNAAGCSPWELTLNGNWVRINNGKIEYRIADGSGIPGQGVDVNSLTAGEVFTDQFVYAIRLGNGTLSEATVTINITGANDSATIGVDAAVPDDRSVSEAGVNPGNTAFPGVASASGKLTIVDADAGENHFQTPSAAALSGTYGSFTFNDTTGVWSYLLNNGLTATQALKQGQVVTETLTVTSADGLTTYPITVTITGTNDAPVAVADTSVATEDGAIVAGTVATNDSDVDTGATLTYSVAAPPAGFAMGADGAWTFDPSNLAYQHLAQGATTTVIVTYVVTDEYGASASSTLSILVTGTNDGPVANLDSGSAGENETKAFDVVANDTDVDDGAVLSLFSIDGVTVDGDPASVAEAGAFSLVGGEVQFTPGSAFDHLALGATASVVVSYTVKDEHGASATSTLTVTVTGTNDGPVANLDSGSAGENETKAFDVVANDTDVDDGAVLSLFSIDGVTVDGDPASVAEAGAFSLVGGEVQFTPGSAFDHLALGASASVVVSYTVKDEHGASATSTLTVTVTGTNDGPVANADTGSAGENESKAFDVVANDTDVDDGAVLSLFSIDGVTVDGVAASVAEAGAFSLVGGEVQFTPGSAFDHLALGASASVVVSYTVKDEHGASASSTLTVTVTGTNDGASIVAEPGGDYEVIEAGGVGNMDSIDWSAQGQVTVSDVDDGEAVFRTPPSLEGIYGTFTFDSNTGQWTYDIDNDRAITEALNVGDEETDTLTVTSADGTDSFDIVVNITGSNDAAVITGTSSGTVTEATPSDPGDPDATGTLFAADVDNPDNVFIAQGSTATATGYGSYTMSAAGVWTYALNNANPVVNGLMAGMFLIDTFTVQSADGTSQTITVTINGATDAIVVTPPATFNGTGDSNDFDGLSAGTLVSGNFTGTNSGETIRGGSADQIFNMNDGNDTAYGAGGNDIITGGDGNDNLYGQAGNDQLFGQGGVDELYGGSGNDQLDGGDNNDLKLYGGSGDDTIVAGIGNDNIFGGYGADTLTGGAGNDAFVYLDLKDTNDSILDFMDSGNDQIDLSALDANSAVALDQVFGWGGNTPTANSLWFSESGGNTTLYGDTDGNVATAEFMILLPGYTGFNAFSDPLSPPPDITF